MTEYDRPPVKTAPLNTAQAWIVGLRSGRTLSDVATEMDLRNSSLGRVRCLVCDRPLGPDLRHL